MKKQDNSNLEQSHNRYYVKHNYRIRLYRDDNKIFEKQITLPKLNYYCLSEQVQDVLSKFIEKIGQTNNNTEKEEYYTNKLMNSLNTAYLFAYMLEELRNE